MYIYICLHIYIHMYTYIYVHTNIHIHTYIYTLTLSSHVRRADRRVAKCKDISTSSQPYIYLYIYLFIYTCIYTYIYIFIYIYMYIYKYIYIYIRVESGGCTFRRRSRPCGGRRCRSHPTRDPRPVHVRQSGPDAGLCKTVRANSARARQSGPDSGLDWSHFSGEREAMFSRPEPRLFEACKLSTCTDEV